MRHQRGGERFSLDIEWIGDVPVSEPLTLAPVIYNISDEAFFAVKDAVRPFEQAVCTSVPYIGAETTANQDRRRAQRQGDTQRKTESVSRDSSPIDQVPPGFEHAPQYPQGDSVVIAMDPSYAILRDDCLECEMVSADHIELRIHCIAASAMLSEESESWKRAAQILQSHYPLDNRDRCRVMPRETEEAITFSINVHRAAISVSANIRREKSNGSEGRWVLDGPTVVSRSRVRLTACVDNNAASFHRLEETVPDANVRRRLRCLWENVIPAIDGVGRLSTFRSSCTQVDIDVRGAYDHTTRRNTVKVTMEDDTSMHHASSILMRFYNDAILRFLAERDRGEAVVTVDILKCASTPSPQDTVRALLAKVHDRRSTTVGAERDLIDRSVRGIKAANATLTEVSAVYDACMPVGIDAMAEAMKLPLPPREAWHALREILALGPAWREDWLRHTRIIANRPGRDYTALHNQRCAIDALDRRPPTVIAHEAFLAFTAGREATAKKLFEAMQNARLRAAMRGAVPNAPGVVLPGVVVSRRSGRARGEAAVFVPPLGAAFAVAVPRGHRTAVGDLVTVKFSDVRGTKGTVRLVERNDHDATLSTVARPLR